MVGSPSTSVHELILVYDSVILVPRVDRKVFDFVIGFPCIMDNQSPCQNIFQLIIENTFNLVPSIMIDGNC